MADKEYLTRADLDVHFSDNLPLDNNGDINEAKISEDIILVRKEIEIKLRRAGITVPVESDEIILELKPIALDYMAARLTNRPAEDVELFEKRKQEAVKTLDLLIEGLVNLGEESKRAGLSFFTLER